MKGLSYLKYALRDTFRALTRHKGMALLTILTIAITLFVLGVVALIAINSQVAAKEVENELEMVIFINEGTEKADIDILGEKIKKIDAVKEIEFVSKDDALKELNKRFDNQGNDLKESLEGENPLPDAYKVKLKNAEESKHVVQKIEKLNFVEEVRYGEHVVQNVIKLNQSVKFLVLFIIALLIFATIFLINSTISLTVSNRNEEIRIMSFIGASKSFIRMPFFLEGIIIGCVGSIIAVTILYFGYNKLNVYIMRNLSFMPFFNNMQIVNGLLIALVVCGIVMGALGSGFAVRKYLKI